MRTRTLFVGFGILAIGVCVPATAAAQQIRVESPAQPWRALDFGKPKTTAASNVGHGKNELREPLLPHVSSHVPFHELFRRSTESETESATCAATWRHTHSGPNWFAPSLPPLPAVQPVLPIFGHHQRSPLLEPVASPCK